MFHALGAHNLMVFAQAAPDVTTAAINDIFANNLAAVTTQLGQAQGAAGQVLIGLATIEFLVFLYRSYLAGAASIVREAVAKLFLVFTLALLIFNWGAVANGVKGYVVGSAAAAGGSSQVTLNPAAIAANGVTKVQSVFTPRAQERIIGSPHGVFGMGYGGDSSATAQDTGLMDGLAGQVVAGLEATAMGYVVTTVVVGLALLIIFIHFYVALQVFVITLDFYITVSITVLLLPFGANPYTSGLATAAFHAVVSKAVKLGVLLMILGMFGTAIETMAIDATPTIYELLALVLGAATLAFMVAQSSQIAASIFSSGGAGIDVGGALMAATATAGTAVASGVAGTPEALSQAQDSVTEGAAVLEYNVQDGLSKLGIGDGPGGAPGGAGQREDEDADPSPKMNEQEASAAMQRSDQLTDAVRARSKMGTFRPDTEGGGADGSVSGAQDAPSPARDPARGPRRWRVGRRPADSGRGPGPESTRRGVDGSLRGRACGLGRATRRGPRGGAARADAKARCARGFDLS